LKSRFAGDDQMVAVDQPLSLMAYCNLVSRLDLMIGMRLHSTLTALRVGVPAINLSYTLKGGDIFRQLGFGDRVVDLDLFMANPDAVYDRAAALLGHPAARDEVSQRVRAIISENERILAEFLEISTRDVVNKPIKFSYTGSTEVTESTGV
jgi:polysaccharide pyruvyl transferase WcaK-like protein